MGHENQLTVVFHIADALHDDVVDEFIVQIVFRLIDELRSFAVQQQNRQDGIAFLPGGKRIGLLVSAVVVKDIGLKEIRNNDFYRSLASYITSDEISAIYDRILPKKKREQPFVPSLRHDNFPTKDEPQSGRLYFASEIGLSKVIYDHECKSNAGRRPFDVVMIKFSVF